MIKDWSVPKILTEISKIKWAATDPRMDGYVTWGCKQDLYQILWHVESCLRQCSTYAGEEEYLQKHSKEEVWRILNDK